MMSVVTLSNSWDFSQNKVVKTISYYIMTKE